MLIRLSSRPLGGIGNRLFSYNFLRQLVYATGSRYSHPQLQDAVYFEKMGLHFLPRWEPNERRITQDDLRNIPARELFAMFRQSDNLCLTLDPPFLGDIFFDYSVVDPASFVVIKEKYRVNPGWRSDVTIAIGAHFRGGDFFLWNPKAILSPSYYIEAIRKAIHDAGGRRFVVVLFTDDVSLESYQAVSHEFRGTCVSYDSRKSSEIMDFYNLSLCDYIISSPSTFCIWAGILSGTSKIVHSLEWMQCRSEQQDRFWLQLLEGGNRYYRLWEAI